MCKKEIPGYFEVYLKCSLKECIRRDKKNVYLPVIQQEKENVIGLDIKYDEPSEPMITLDSETSSAEECLQTLWQDISGNLFDNRLRNQQA